MWGAAYFEEKLIDYCPANNWGNWAYIAGVGNDPREYRYFNVLKQALDYDSQGNYVKLWFPELSPLSPENIHQPWKISEDERAEYQLKSFAKAPVYAPELGATKGKI
jgi:deoxyribodipyrimidine photo-lyase